MYYSDSALTLSHDDISENVLGVRKPESSPFVFLDKVSPITVLANMIALKDMNVVIVLGSSNYDSEVDFSTSPGLKIILYTSGSTGSPKPVLKNFSELVPRTSNMRDRELRWGLLFDHEKMAGLQVLLSAYYRQEPLFCPSSSEPLKGKVDYLIDHDVNALSATPSLWRNILQLDSIARLNLSQVTLGGEKSDNVLLQELATRFQGATIDQIYASSELGYIFSVKDAVAGFPREYLQKYSMRVDENSELSIKRGAEWFPTGDLVEFHDQRIVFSGRVDAIVNIGGVKVDPFYVENTIKSIDGVKDVIVSGIRNPILGAILVSEVIVQENSNLSERHIKQILEENLDKVQIPAIVKIVTNFSLNSNGKRGISQ